MRKGGDENIVFLAFCQMHSCKDVGRGLANHILCLAYDVYNTLVRTSSKEYCIAVFFNDEILLMGKRVILLFGWSEQQSVTLWTAKITDNIGKDGHLIIKPCQRTTLNKAWIIFQISVQTYIFQSVLLLRIMRLKSILVDIYLRLIVDFEKGTKSTAMIIMPMRYYRRVNIGNVESELFGIFCKQPSLSHVKQNFVSVFKLDIQAQTMFHRHTYGTGILYKRCNRHSIYFTYPGLGRCIPYIVSLFSRAYFNNLARDSAASF